MTASNLEFSHSRSQQMLTLFLMIATIPLTGMAIDIFVPSLPAITQYFSVSATAAKLTVALYLIAYGVSQLLTGVLSDRYGRRPFLLGGLFVFALSSFLAAYSHNITQLLVARFIQGLSVGAPAVVCRAVLSDCFSGERIRRYTNYLVTAWSIGVIIAPMIGSYLQVHLNWQASFYFLGLYSTVVLILSYKLLPETHQTRGKHRIKTLIGLMGQVVTHRVFLAYTMIMALIYSIITLFHVTGPFLVQNVLHYSVTSYGRIALLMGVFWFIGSLIATRLANVMSSQSIIRVGSLILVSIAIFMLMLAEHATSLYGILIPLYLLMLVGVIVFVNAFGTCMSLFPELGGISASVMGAFFVSGSGLATIIGSHMVSHSAVPLALSYLLFTLLVLILSWAFSQD